MDIAKIHPTPWLGYQELCASPDFFDTAFSQALDICILCENSFISINTLESVMHISSQLTLSEPET